MRATLLLGLALCLLPAACVNEPWALVKRIDSRSETIGGPSAVGTVGDFLLENDRIRVIINGRPDETGSTVTFGGTIVDADLQRPFLPSLGGDGNDQFLEIGPLVNLKTLHPRVNHCPSGQACYADDDCRGEEHCSREFGCCVTPCESSDDCREILGATCAPSSEAKSCEKPAFQILRERGDRNHGAILRVEGTAANLVEVIGLVDVMIPEIDASSMTFRVDYELRAGESFVRISTEVYPKDGYPSGFANGRTPIPMSGLEGSESLLAMLAGDIEPSCSTDADCPDPAESCATVVGTLKACRSPQSAGFGNYGGTLALLGGKLKPFVTGAGFDPWLNLQSAVAQGLDFFSHPVPFPFMAGVGDDVSYAIFSGEGQMLVPVASADFTVALTNEAHCTISDPDCFADFGLRMTTFFSLGQGDVASATAPFYAERHLPVGRLNGVVINAWDGSPVSQANVLVLSDPWPDVDDASVVRHSYHEVASANRAQSQSTIRPAGDSGVVTHFRTDIGPGDQPDGRFSGPLLANDPGGRYLLFVQHGPVVSEQPVIVRIQADESVETVMVVPATGTLEYETQDQSGRPIPAKLTIGQCLADCAFDQDCVVPGRYCHPTERRCVPVGGCHSSADCDPDEWCESQTATCQCRVVGEIPRELGGKWRVDGVTRTELSGTGKGALALAEGVYEVIFSRGFEYSISRHFVSIQPGQTVRVVAHLDRVVDTSSYIAGDFHVHGGASADSGISLTDRVVSYAAEGVEFMSSADHDVLTDYGPFIREQGLDRWLMCQVGIESSPLVLSHFLGFPLRYDDTQPQNMPAADAFDWFGKTPLQIMRSLRSLGDESITDEPVVIIPHIFDYFGYFGFDSTNLSVNPGLYALADPLFQASNFSGAFDGMEIANGKNLDYIRRPTLTEFQKYGAARATLVKRFQLGELDMDGYVAEHILLGRQAIADILSRTASEQTLFMDSLQRAPCSCATDIDCGTGQICNVGQSICAPSCSSNLDCTDSESVCNTLRGQCVHSCSADSDCSTVPGNPATCDLTQAFCVQADFPPDAPCDKPGVVDDWFRMLNRGIVRSAMSNSDSHAADGVEAGLPRNYVFSDTDVPAQLSRRQINQSVREGRLVTTYGPFIRFSIDGVGPGGTVAAAFLAPVELSISVQSPLWFDVDRVEIYRNGSLWRLFEGCDVSPTDGECIVVPNDRIDNLVVTLTDTLDRDTWYVVIAVGGRGKDLTPIYSSSPLERFGMLETMQSLFEVVPIAGTSGHARGPSVHPTFPFALTNPIWVDIGGDGISCPDNLPLPSWAHP